MINISNEIVRTAQAWQQIKESARKYKGQCSSSGKTLIQKAKIKSFRNGRISLNFSFQG